MASSGRFLTVASIAIAWASAKLAKCARAYVALKYWPHRFMNKIITLKSVTTVVIPHFPYMVKHKVLLDKRRSRS